MDFNYRNLPEMLIDEPVVPEWVLASGHRLLSPWITDTFRFAFNDPTTFSDTPVNPQVFVQLLQHLVNDHDAKETAILRLLNWFSAHCTEAEWHDFYQPVLMRKPDHGLTMARFNSYAGDEEYVVRPFTPPEKITTDTDEVGYFYPYSDEWTRVFIFVHNDYVEVTTDTFGAWSYPAVERVCSHLCGQQNINYPLVFEAVTDGHDVTLLDVFELQSINLWPCTFRRKLLEDAYAFLYKQDTDHTLSLSEGIKGTWDDLKNISDEFVAQGYKGNHAMLFKTAKTPYTDPPRLVII